jgi:hypothetical protein
VLLCALLILMIRLKSLEFDDACLCNAYASNNPGSVVYMWAKQVCFRL